MKKKTRAPSYAELEICMLALQKVAKEIKPSDRVHVIDSISALVTPTGRRRDTCMRDNFTILYGPRST